MQEKIFFPHFPMVISQREKEIPQRICFFIKGWRKLIAQHHKSNQHEHPGVQLHQVR